jgi:aromatic-L-amino-acid decarboxylase
MPVTREDRAMEDRDIRRSFAWHQEPELFDLGGDGTRQKLEDLGQQAWTLALDYLYEEALVRPVGPDSYPDLRERFFGPSKRPSRAPAEPSLSGDVLAEIRERLLPYLYNAYHPRSFSYFTPPPLVMSIVGELLSQWFHQGIDVFHAGPVGALVEEEVTCWLVELVGLGERARAVLTSGGVMANLMAVTVARDRHLASLLETKGPPRGASLETARVYVSDQAHFSIARALDILGFPPSSLSVIESDDRFRLQAGAVAEQVRRDKAAGLVPFCIAAVSGSTNTGSVDDVPALSELASAEHLWLHVDAAYGGAARLSSRDAGRVPGLELADSVTIDPHKWFFQAYDIGALLVREGDDLHSTFRRAPEYYRSALPETLPLNWMEYSIEGTRRFRALKLWASWKHLGTSGLGAMVELNNDVAAFLAEVVRSAPDFEAAVDVPELSVVCFRHLQAGLEGDDLDTHQDRLQRALEVSGECWVSTTRLRGCTYLRAGVMNWLSTNDEALQLLESLRRLAAGLETGPQADGSAAALETCP